MVGVGVPDAADWVSLIVILAPTEPTRTFVVGSLSAPINVLEANWTDAGVRGLVAPVAVNVTTAIGPADVIGWVLLAAPTRMEAVPFSITPEFNTLGALVPVVMAVACSFVAS
jgi:hypothetical protein